MKRSRAGDRSHRARARPQLQASLPLGGVRPRVPRLPRRRVGPADRRRRAAVREDLPGGLPGRVSPGSRSFASARRSAARSRGSTSRRWRASAPRDVTRLLGDAGIVRHRGKIESADPQRAPRLRAPRRGRLARGLRLELRARPTLAAEAAHLGDAPDDGPDAGVGRASKDLRRRGWTFVGPTTLYAFMQAVGIVNDHLDGCAFRARAERARRAFERPRARPR